LQSFSGQQQFKTVIRKVLVRNADGTTRIVNETKTIAPSDALTRRKNERSRPACQSEARPDIEWKILDPAAKSCQQAVRAQVAGSPTASPIQKIITSTGQVITQQVQGNIISQANLQQLLQRGNVQSGQKIVVQSVPGGVKKLLVASPQQGQQV
jgi:hypothetical protein